MRKPTKTKLFTPKTTLQHPVRLTEEELAEYWGIRKSNLQKWRTDGTGPLYIKVGAKPIYSMEAIQEYERERTFKGTGDRVVFPTEGGKNDKR